jgi:hypothetical protein
MNEGFDAGKAPLAAARRAYAPLSVARGFRSAMNWSSAAIVRKLRQRGIDLVKRLDHVVEGVDDFAGIMCLDLVFEVVPDGECPFHCSVSFDRTTKKPLMGSPNTPPEC